VAGGGSFSGRSTREIAPLDQKLGFNSAGGLVFAAGARREDRVDFVDEDDAGGECFGECEEGTDEFFAFAELFIVSRRQRGGMGEAIRIC
jgi:hypothetical protein